MSARRRRAGGGAQGTALLRAGARLVVVAATLTPGLRELAGEPAVTWRRRAFRDNDLDGMRLAIVAADDDALAGTVANAARRRGIPVNVVDRRSLCSFILPSILDRSPLVAAVSTGGAAPILARILRARLETLIPARFGRLARFIGEVRPTVLRRIADPAPRRRFFEGVVDGPIGELVLADARTTPTPLWSPRSSNPKAPPRPARSIWSAPGREIRTCSPSGRSGSCSRRTSSSTTVSCRRRCSI